MQMLYRSRPDSIRQSGRAETAECKFRYGSTSYGLSICNDCSRTRCWRIAPKGVQCEPVLFRVNGGAPETCVLYVRSLTFY
jgi:hypothetical protein